jgi:hypothetical protein
MRVQIQHLFVAALIIVTLIIGFTYLSVSTDESRELARIPPSAGF